jgi:hypothetical protein
MTSTTPARLLIMLLALPISAPGLNPPWHLLEQQVAAALGADPSVRVDRLDTTTAPYRIEVHVADSTKAQALASVVKPHHELGNLAVDVRIIDFNGRQVQPLPLTTVTEVVETFHLALGSNPLFVAAFERSNSPRDSVGVVFRKALLQYPSGDTGELYGNANVAAATVFGDILLVKHGNVTLVLGTSRLPDMPSSTGAGIESAHPARY